MALEDKLRQNFQRLNPEQRKQIVDLSEQLLKEPKKTDQIKPPLPDSQQQDHENQYTQMLMRWTELISSSRSDQTVEDASINHDHYLYQLS